MNVIADRLFGLLLGWTRGLFNSLWNLVTNHSSGIVGFFERFWLPLIVILLVVGTAADFIVWIIRWRPYYVWRSWFMRRDRHKRMQATQAYMTDLDHAPLDLGYGLEEETPFYSMPAQDEAVAFPESDGFPYAPHAPSPEETYHPVQHQPLVQAPPLQAPAYPEPELPFAAWTAQPAPEAEPLWQEAPYLADNSHQPAWDDPVRQETAEAYPMPEEPAADPQGSRRRRRTETKRQRQPGLLRALRETLIDPIDPDAHLDSLPPPISQEEAFHQPYYPENYRYRPSPQGDDDSINP